MQTFARVALLTAAGFALAGCGGSGSKLVVSGGHEAVSGVNLVNGARLLSPTRLAIVTMGSSSCPAVPDRLVVQNRDTIRIHLTEGSWRPANSSHHMVLVAQPPSNGICTTDLGPTPIVVAINPKQIDVHHPLTIHLYYYGLTKPVTRTAPAL
jgi:hypothetical protein